MQQFVWRTGVEFVLFDRTGCLRLRISPPTKSKFFNTDVHTCIGKE